jgi:hypothetical protein
MGYRYSLTRDTPTIMSGRGPIVFVMLNPSTADAENDDPTIRKCMTIARHHGAGFLEVVNLFAWRATDPKALPTATDPVGPENNTHIRMAVQRATVAGAPVILGWGPPTKLGRARALLERRSSDVLEMLRPWREKLFALSITKDGSPGHPLFLRTDSPLIPFPRGRVA